MNAEDIMENSFVKVDKEDVLSKLIGKLIKSKKNEAVILDGKKYYGVMDKRKLLKSRRDVSEEKVKNISKKPAVLKGDESLKDISLLMYDSDSHMLPVVNKGSLKGVVHAIDVLKNMGSIDSSLMDNKVMDFVKRKVIAFEEDAEIGKVMQAMREENIDHAPIINSHHKLVGIVSTIDLFLKFMKFPKVRDGSKSIKLDKFDTGKKVKVLSLPIINEATTDVVTLEKHDRIKTVISFMDRHDVSSIVIINDFNEPISLVSITDILRIFGSD